MKITMSGSGRTDLFNVPPEKLTIVGGRKCPEGACPGDTNDGLGHALFDERLLMPLVEGNLEIMRDHGPTKVVVVRKNGRDDNGEDILQVVHGRTTTRYAREVNRRARKGEPQLLVQCMVTDADDRELAALRVIENEIRTDTPMETKARDAAQLINAYKWTVDKVAQFYRTTPQTVKTWLSLHSLAPEVRAEVASGKVAPSAAAQLAKLPREKQAAKLEEARATTKPGKKPSLRKIRDEVKKDHNGGRVAPGRREIRRVVDHGTIPADAMAALQWVMGDIDAPSWASVDEEK